MIVSRSPLRISLLGGGSDLPIFYNDNDGLVLSTSIDSYIYIAVNKCATEHVRVIYSELEVAKNVDTVKHNIVREVLRHYLINSNIEICSFSNVSTTGTGLGSSSAFAVGLVNAMHNLEFNKHISKQRLAELACQIEIEKCKSPIGKQDQYQSSFGGFNLIHFNKNNVEVEPLEINMSIIHELNNNLLCFNTGKSRRADTILKGQNENLKNKEAIDLTKQMVTMAHDGAHLLKHHKLDDLGALIGESWKIKKQLSYNISNPKIDDMYEKAIKAGAIGGKLLGAGSGGYLLVYAKPKHHGDVIQALDKYDLFKFNFEDAGSTIEMNS